MKSIEISISIL